MRLRRLLVCVATSVAALVACSSNDELVAKVPGGTAPPDGADGVCCPVSTGGCADIGGYSADGTGCMSFCDGMCNQQIVSGEHGCRVLQYTPCNSVDAGPSRPDAATDGGADAEVPDASSSDAGDASDADR